MEFRAHDTYMDVIEHHSIRAVGTISERLVRYNAAHRAKANSKYHCAGIRCDEDARFMGGIRRSGRGGSLQLGARGARLVLWSCVLHRSMCGSAIRSIVGLVARCIGRIGHRALNSRGVSLASSAGRRAEPADRAGRPSRPVERLRLPAEEFPCSSSKSVFCMHSMHACTHACCASMHHILHIMHIRHIMHITHICMYACVHACVHACMYVCEPRLPATGAGRPSWSAEPAGRALRQPSPHLNPPNEVF